MLKSAALSNVGAFFETVLGVGAALILPNPAMTNSAERGKSIFRKTEKELVQPASAHHSEAVHGFPAETTQFLAGL